VAEIYSVHFGVLNLGELPSEVSEIGDDWETTFKGKRAKILTNLQRVVPDESAYRSKIVDRSNEGYSAFISESHPDYNKIMLKRKTKMPARASDYIANRDAAFAEGGDFESGVTESKGAFMTNVKVILRVVGDKDKVYGAIPKLSYALDGKKELLEEILNDTYDHLITSTDLKRFFVKKAFKTSVVAIANEALAYVVYAIDAGYDDTWITNNIANVYNPLIAAMINSDTVNSELDPTACSITVEKDSTTGRWGIKIVEATPA